MRKTLIVIDMQNDFVLGVLGTSQSESIIPNIRHKIEEYLSNGDEVIFTRDTHTNNYLNTNEGKHLPIVHCVKDSVGWDIVRELNVPGCEHIDKSTFGYTDWGTFIDSYGNMHNREFNEIEIVGVCTDICVVSNAIILKALYPEVNITVDASCCAGVTPESHKAALTVMNMCQINITGVTEV